MYHLSGPAWQLVWIACVNAGRDLALPSPAMALAMSPATSRVFGLSTLLGSALLLLGATGCRADEEGCRDLARHVAELAAAEDKAGAGTAVALEADCNRLRPTRGLVECMVAAQSLAEVDGC